MRRLARAVAAPVALLVLFLLGGCGGGQHTALPLPSHVKVSTTDLAALKQQAGIETCRPGRGSGKLPDVTLACLGGGPSVDLSGLHGPMLLSFWGAWCDQCPKDMPLLQAFHQRAGSRVPVVGIDFLDTYPGSALEMASKAGVTYPLLADPGGELQTTAAFAQVRELPYLAFVDADGEVVFGKYGAVGSAQELTDLVRDHLGVEL